MKQVIHTVLSCLNGVVLNFLQPQIVRDEIESGVGKVAWIEANDLQVIMLREGNEVAAPLCLLGANKAVIAVPTDRRFWATYNEFMWGSQEITALKAFFVCAERVVVDTWDILGYIIKVLDVHRCKFLSILLAEAHSLERLLSEGNLTLVWFADAVVNQSHAMVRTAHGGQAAHLSTGAEQGDSSTTIDAAETVCHQVHLTI